jgi:hypothetical protein
VTPDHAYPIGRLQANARRWFGVAIMLSTLLFVAATPRRLITGYVVDGSGTPVARASIRAVCVSAGPPWASPGGGSSPRIIAATRSDAEGYFELLIPRTERSRVNCIFYDHGSNSGVVLSVSYARSMRLILHKREQINP